MFSCDTVREKEKEFIEVPTKFDMKVLYQNDDYQSSTRRYHLVNK